jgi:hypothetical protein
MSKNLQILLRLCFVFIVIVIGNYVIVAQTTLTGNWTANNDNFRWNRPNRDEENEKEKLDKDKVYLNFSYQSPRGKGDSNHGSSYAYSDLQGLTRQQAEAGGSVNFRLVREAGTIECTGNFQNGKGSGTFRFTANPQYISAMKSRGFDFEAPSKNRRNSNDRDETDVASRLFAATTINVTTAIADDLKSANFPNLDVDDLFKAAIFKVNSGFMKEMAATGFPNLSMEDLVKARIFKINADFVRNVVAMGFKDKSFEDLVKYSIFKITPEFLRDMQSAGFSNLSSEEAVKLRIFNVTPEFISQMKSEGLTNLSVEQATKLKIFNIDAAFIRKAKADNVPLRVENLVERRIGVWHRDDN